MWLHHVQAPHLGVCGSADSSWSEIRKCVWRTCRWGRRASTGPDKKKKESPVAGWWCIDQMVRLIGKTRLQWYFCKMTLLWMFRLTFKVNVQWGALKADLVFIWSKWMLIWTRVITLIVVRITAVFKEISCDWCYKINVQCTTYTKP